MCFIVVHKVEDVYIKTKFSVHQLSFWRVLILFSSFHHRHRTFTRRQQLLRVSCDFIYGFVLGASKTGNGKCACVVCVCVCVCVCQSMGKSPFEFTCDMGQPPMSY